MSLKRQRPAHTWPKPQDRQNKRPKVNLDLAQIWENLVDEDEDVRLSAVYELLTVHCNSNDGDNARTIAKRLFRGLCSSRKNARQGFYVALVGALSLENSPFGTIEITLSDIVQILDAQTTPEAGTSGQDERDHHFGRLLGCKALLESKALWVSGNQFLGGWDHIIDLLCKLMAQKPWLRPESNIVIRSTIPRILEICSNGAIDVSLVLSPLFQRLKVHKLLRTIDGVGIWLEFLQQIPNAKPPKDIWAFNSPLHANELQSLKKILLTKRDSKEEDDLLGTSVWSPKLHPAWASIIRQFRQSRAGQVSFEKFWQEVVDQGLFDPSSTPERKYTGFLVLGCALKEIDPGSISCCFSKNLMACLIQSLQNSHEAYLRQVILKVFEEFEAFAGTNKAAGVHEAISGLIRGSDFADFDTLTKTKMVSSLFHLKPLYDGMLKESLVQDLKDSADSEVPIAKIARKRKMILNVFSRALCQGIRELTSEEKVSQDSHDDSWKKIEGVLDSLLDLRESAVRKSGDMVEWDETSYASLQEKIAIILEACLAAGSGGQQCFIRVVTSLQKKVKLEAEETIQESLNASWRLFKKLSKDSTLREVSDVDRQTQEGLRLLQALLLHEVYDGNTEAIEMLEDVTSMGQDFLADRDPSKIADPTLEIIVTLMSKPSRFRRRACSLVFDAFAAHVSSAGLETICRIFATKESTTGQQELFENGDDGLSDGSDGEDGGTNPESLDSDVEVVSGSEDGNDSDEEDTDAASSDNEASVTNSDASSDSDNATSDEKDDELAKFEDALAAALGTRKFNEGDMADLDSDGNSDTSTDSDMSDSKMMELDDKLAEVFRNQQDQNSAQKMRKEEMRNAKENVINLKNRALDLTEQFFRSQHRRGSECAELLVSVIQLAKMTGASQLANRAISLAKAFAQKNKGTRLPRVEANESVREELWYNLQSLHQTAAQKDASNSLIEAASHINILLCKLLSEAGENDIQRKMSKLSATHRAKQEGVRKAHEDLWTRYNDWAAAMIQRPGTSEPEAVVKSLAGGKNLDDWKKVRRG